MAEKKKGFFKNLFEKLDKKIEEKSKAQTKGCCCQGDKDKNCCK